MADQLTPEQIQQALDAAETYSGSRWSGTPVWFLARAVLALTEQLEPVQRESSLAQRISTQCTCEYPYPREIWAGHHPNCATEQQPEPVSDTELTTFVYDTALANLLDIDGDTPSVLATGLLSRYTITRQQPEPERSPVCECGEDVERWGQPCAACRVPADPEDAAELARGGYRPDSEETAGE